MGQNIIFYRITLPTVDDHVRTSEDLRKQSIHEVLCSISTNLDAQEAISLYYATSTTVIQLELECAPAIQPRHQAIQ